MFRYLLLFYLIFIYTAYTLHIRYIHTAYTLLSIAEQDTVFTRKDKLLFKFWRSNHKTITYLGRRNSVRDYCTSISLSPLEIWRFS